LKVVSAETAMAAARAKRVLVNCILKIGCLVVGLVGWLVV
jgi:hypothetical protein